MKKKILKSIKKGIKDVKKGRVISFSKLEKKWAKEVKWEKIHPVLTKLKRFWWWIKYGIKNKLEDIPLNIKSFIQRGKRGWSNRDTWSLDYYLSNTISKTVRHLKEHVHGVPIGLTKGKWVDILNTIAEAFDFARRCSDGDLYLIRNKRKRKQWQKHLDEINKAYNNNHRCMNDKEIKAYDVGWKNFQHYFFNLWD